MIVMVCWTQAMANADLGSRYIEGTSYTLNRQLRIYTYMQQLTGDSHFHNDLGLDSLDTVEVVMAIEEVSYVEMWVI
jgi:acyl carrier protein